MLNVGLLFVSLAGFLFGGVLVDQIEAFFTENRREEQEIEENEEEKDPETGQKRAS